MVQLSKPPEETVKMGIKDGAVLYWWILFLQMACSFHFRRACGAHLLDGTIFFEAGRGTILKLLHPTHFI